jgi:transcriptional regulator with XRE-family HTH domain
MERNRRRQKELSGRGRYASGQRKGSSLNRTQRQFIFLKRKYETAKNVAKIAKLSEGMVSRILSGKTMPTRASIKTLVSALPTEDAAQLFAAFLSDQIPRSLRRSIRIIANNHPSIDEFVNQLSPEGFELIEKLARLCLEDEELCHVFAQHVNLFTERRRRYSNEALEGVEKAPPEPLP